MKILTIFAGSYRPYALLEMPDNINKYNALRPKTTLAPRDETITEANTRTCVCKDLQKNSEKD
jgi:hypothetical protein